MKKLLFAALALPAQDVARREIHLLDLCGDEGELLVIARPKERNLTQVCDARIGFLPLAEECYDFVVPKSRLDRPAIKAFRELLADRNVRSQLDSMGFRLS